MGQARARTAAVLLALALAGCQGFPERASAGKGILAENGMPVVVGMSPVQANQTRQLNVALQIKKAGGDIFHNMSLYPASTVGGVDLHHTQVSDADLPNWRFFPIFAQSIYNTHIGRRFDEHRRPARFADIASGDTQISDAGLLARETDQLARAWIDPHPHNRSRHGLSGQTDQLDELSLSGSQITDAGLKDLHSPTHLRKLVLLKTGVSKAGVQQLQRAIPMCMSSSVEFKLAPIIRSKLGDFLWTLRAA